MSNRFNYRCPKCGSPDEIEICAFVSVRLTNDGAKIATTLGISAPKAGHLKTERGAGLAALRVSRRILNQPGES